METKPTGNKTILIILGVLVVVCCLCTALAGGGAAAYFALRPSATEVVWEPAEEATVEAEPLPVEPTEEVEVEEEPTEEPTEEPVEEPTARPTATEEAASQSPDATQAPSGDLEGLDVTREEMIEYLNSGNAFEFGEPFDLQGLEMVIGTHKSLCIKDNCAAATLGGPAENLQVIAVAAPTDPDDPEQMANSMALLMTTAARFTDDEGAEELASKMFSDIFTAQITGQDVETTMENNGYVFTMTYEAATGNIGLGISRPK